MIIKHGNMWDHVNEADLFCITTNSVIKKSGELVMGAGIAGEAVRRMPQLPRMAGQYLLERNLQGGAYFILNLEEVNPKASPFVLFQTKYHFSEKSSLYLIHEAALMLQHDIQKKEKELGHPPVVHLNFPGIGLGGLSEKEVLPKIDFLPDCVTVWKR